MLLVCTPFSNYAATRVPGMPIYLRITSASVICDDILLFSFKIHKHVFICNRTEVMISFDNVVNEFVACLLINKSIKKKKHVFLPICSLYNSRTNYNREKMIVV